MKKSAVDKAIRNKELDPSKVFFHKKALVIGGGIAGIRVALDIANAGFPVVLVEKKPTIGGHMAKLAEVFPTMDLANNILTPLMNEVSHKPNIKLLTLSKVAGVEGDLGNFHIRIKKNPRYVDPDKCNPDKCNECEKVCPVTVPSDFDEGLTLRKAIYIPFPKAVPSTYTIDQDVCISCGKCAQPEVCSPRAVNLAEEEEIIEEDVGAVIITTGYELYSQENVEAYGVDECPDVVTSLQFERLLSPEGPTAGIPKRLSDGKIPKEIGFIHDAGSRDERHLPCCNHICCIYLAKQAILFKKSVPNGKVYSLLADVKAEEKNCEYFTKRAQEEAGVNYIRGKVSRIHQQDGKVKILYVDSLLGENMELEVDMAVLALPMAPSFDIKDLADQMRIEVDEYGFLRQKRLKSRQGESATSGIFTAGCAQTPMDIQAAVAQAGAVARKVLEVLTQIERARDLELKSNKPLGRK